MESAGRDGAVQAKTGQNCCSRRASPVFRGWLGRSRPGSNGRKPRGLLSAVPEVGRGIRDRDRATDRGRGVGGKETPAGGVPRAIPQIRIEIKAPVLARKSIHGAQWCYPELPANFSDRPDGCPAHFKAPQRVTTDFPTSLHHSAGHNLRGATLIVQCTVTYKLRQRFATLSDPWPRELRRLH